MCGVLRTGPGTQEGASASRPFLAIHIETRFPRHAILQDPGSKVTDSLMKKKRGIKTLKARGSQNYTKQKYHVECSYTGDFAGRSSDEIAGRKPLARRKGVKRQTATPCFFNKPQQKKLGAGLPRSGGEGEVEWAACSEKEMERRDKSRTQDCGLGNRQGWGAGNILQH